MDFGRVIEAGGERLTGETVDHKYARRQDGKILEHIFENVCVVRWNAKEQTIEYVSDLSVKGTDNANS